MKYKENPGLEFEARPVLRRKLDGDKGVGAGAARFASVGVLAASLHSSVQSEGRSVSGSLLLSSSRERSQW